MGYVLRHCFGPYCVTYIVSRSKRAGFLYQHYSKQNQKSCCLQVSGESFTYVVFLI